MENTAETRFKQDLLMFGDQISSYIVREEYQKVNEMIKDNSRLSKILKRYLINIMPLLNEKRTHLEAEIKDNPNHFENTYKLAAVCQLMDDRYRAIDYYYQALKISPSESIRHDVIHILETQFNLEQDQIPILFETKMIKLLMQGEINQAIHCVETNPQIEAVYRAELHFFDGNSYLQEFIIRLITNAFQDYHVQEAYANYINGHRYYYYRYYNEALSYYEKLDEGMRSPLVLRHLAFLYQSQHKFDEAQTLFQRYLLFVKGDCNES